MFPRLRRLAKSPPPAEVRAALREAYLSVFGLIAAPGVLLGALLALVGANPVGFAGPALAALLGVSLACAALVFWLAARARKREEVPLTGAIHESIQLASAPAVPFLLGCAALREPGALAWLWGAALLVLAVGWVRLRG